MHVMLYARDAPAQNISTALAKMNYFGQLSICAYGDTNGIPTTIQHALNSTAITLSHVPGGVKDASDKKIIVDMFCWALDNPAPANVMLISGDRDFSNALHQLGMRGYNILLAQPQKASEPLIQAAKTVWLWKSLSAGGNPLTTSRSLQLVANDAPPPTSGSPQNQQPDPSGGNGHGVPRPCTCHRRRHWDNFVHRHRRDIVALLIIFTSLSLIWIMLPWNFVMPPEKNEENGDQGDDGFWTNDDHLFSGGFYRPNG